MKPTVLGLALTISACATVPADRPVARASSCTGTAASLQSPPGRDWQRDHGWRFANPAAAEKAYGLLVSQSSAWPDWFTPAETELPAGTRFQMVIGPTQTAQTPGRWGTFDRIATVSDVRTNLAVRRAWKPKITSIVTYEVTAPLPARVGPIGPQVDPDECRLLPGRFSQLEMLVPEGERMRYLKVIEIRPIRS